MGKGNDSALWSEIGRAATVLSVLVVLYTIGIALAPDFPDPIGSREQTLRRWRLQQQDSNTQ